MAFKTKRQEIDIINKNLDEKRMYSFGYKF